MRMGGFKASLLARRQQGLSLVELLISLAISAGLLLTAMMQVLMTSLEVEASTGDLARMQESGRSALNIIGRAVRQAGSRFDFNQDFSGVPVQGVNNNGNQPDQIELQFDARAGGETDCQGLLQPEGTLMRFPFTVNRNARLLLCNGQPVVQAIENMQIRYGLDMDQDGRIDGPYIPNPTPVQFESVAAVRISVLVRSADRNSAANETQTVRFNGQTLQFDDGFLRHVYTSTFAVRNLAG